MFFPTLIRLPAAVLLAFAAALPLAAQEPATPDASRVGTLTDSLTFIKSFEGRDDTVATMVQRFRRTTLDGKPVIEQAGLYHSRRGGITADTVWLEVPSLFPVRHRSSGTGSRAEFDFTATTVRGTLLLPGRPPEAIADSFAVRPYEAATSDLLIRALPLREGLTAEFPAYTVGFDGLSSIRVRSVRAGQVATPDGARAAWIVESDVLGSPVTLTVDRENGQIIELVEHYSDGSVGRYVR